MKWAAALGWFAAVALALALRCPQLNSRPMHNDEAVNAIKFRQLWEQGKYKYDPNEHHGPALPYATLAFSRLTRAPDFAHFTETRLRLVTVAFGVGLILLLPLMRSGLGRNATAWAALLMAVSPAMVFYSRYYIHEMLLVFFTLLALASAWRYCRNQRLGWALLAGAAVGLMDATKETCVLTLAAAALALVLNVIWNRRVDAASGSGAMPRFNVKHLAAALGVWLAVAVVLFSSFFTNAAGPLDSVRTYLPWLHRAEGNSPHIHPWDFYLVRLLYFHVANGPVWTEVFILLLAVVGSVAAFRHKGLADANASFIRFLVFFTLTLTAIYSLISYKTPWCLLNFWLGMILLAGVGAAAVLQYARRRWQKAALSVALLTGVGNLAWQAWRASVPYAADQRNPYIYAQTSPDILNLVDEVEALARVSPLGRQMVLKVMAPGSDYWPLPWYFRGFRHVGWWSNIPEDPLAPVMIISTELHPQFRGRNPPVMVGYFQLRPQVFFQLFVEPDLWKTYLERNDASR